MLTKNKILCHEYLIMIWYDVRYFRILCFTRTSFLKHAPGYSLIHLLWIYPKNENRIKEPKIEYRVSNRLPSIVRLKRRPKWPAVMESRFIPVTSMIVNWMKNKLFDINDGPFNSYCTIIVSLYLAIASLGGRIH